METDATQHSQPERSAALLIAEVAVVTAAYVAVTRISVASFDAAPLLPQSLSPRDAAVGGVFLVGALAQLLFVIAAASTPWGADFRRAIRRTWRPATRPAWVIAMTAAAIQCVTIVLFFIPDPAAVAELSGRNALLSVLPVTDGWSQEV